MKWIRKKCGKTRNAVLFVAIGAVIAYTVTNIVFGFIGMKYSTVFQLDSTQTSEWFSFWKWVVVSGATITVAKTVKGDTNSDNDEKSPPDDGGEA